MNRLNRVVVEEQGEYRFVRAEVEWQEDRLIHMVIDRNELCHGASELEWIQAMGKPDAEGFYPLWRLRYRDGIWDHQELLADARVAGTLQ